MIQTLSQLKTSATFSKLDLLQSKIDNDDMVLNEKGFTRSPYQLLSFLVAYAGLSAEQRAQVVANLPKEEEARLSKEELDALLDEIDWSAILQNPANSPLTFHFSVGIKDKNAFYEAIKKHYPKLFEPISAAYSVVTIKEEDKLIFISEVNQEVTWLRSFDGESQWNVPHLNFQLNENLEQKIKSLEPGSVWSCGGFKVHKGNSKGVNLYIRAAEKDNTYRETVKDIEVSSGIYNAFLGLNNFYGQVDPVIKVSVKLSNTATFSDKGATASQVQVVEILAGCSPHREDRPRPTNIFIDNPLNVYYQGIDVMTSLGAKEKREETEDGSQYCLSLAVKEEAVGIKLFPNRLTPSQMHELNFNSKITPVEQITKPAIEAESVNSSKIEKKSAPKSKTTLMVLGGFIAALGIAAVALAFTVLNAVTLGLAGLIVAGAGLAAALGGFGLFLGEACKKAKAIQPEAVQTSLQAAV